MLSEIGAYAVTLHDNDLVLIDATASERNPLIGDFKKVLSETGLKVPTLKPTFDALGKETNA